YITVASAMGQGTMFSLYLPTHLPLNPAGGDDEVHSAAPPVVNPVAKSGALVLVVDDEPGLRASTARMLQGAGYRVVLAADGAQALEMIAHEATPDLVLTDLTMAGMSGIELAEQVHRRWPALPLIFMSGYSATVLKEVRYPGVPGPLLQKPFTIPELLATVQLALRTLTT
ncbi:MAG: response regulator, partial [Gemmatimonadales bacterium]